MNTHSFPAFEPLAEEPADPAPAGPPILAQYWKLARDNWIAIAAICALALAAGFVTILLSTRLYTAETRIEISRPADTVTQVEGVQSDDYLQNLEYYETQYALLRAESLAERVASAQRLAQDDSFFELHGVDPEARYAEISAEARGQQTMLAFRRDLAAEILLDNLRIRPVSGSALVDVLYSSPSPELSARIANSWVEQYIEAALARRFNSSERARTFLETRLEELRGKLEDSERNLVTYAANTGIVTLAQAQDADGTTRAERTVATADLEALNTALAQATARRISAEARYRQGDTAKTGSAESQALAALRRERAVAQARYAELMTRFEPGYPEAQAIASQIAQLGRSIAAEEARETRGAAAEFRAAAQQESALRSRVEALKAQVIAQQGDSIQYGIFQREVDTNRELYNALLQRYKELGVSDVDKSNIAVIDRAEVPQFPSSPRAPVNLGLSLLVGLALAGGFIFAKTNLDQALRDPAQVKPLFGVPLLGAIPQPEGETDAILTEIADRKSALHEAYLALRSNLQFLTRDGAPASLLLTSTVPNEGKSSSAIAVAQVLSETGGRVLLVDADLRNPSLGRLLEARSERGLSNVLAGEASADAMLVQPEGWDFHLLGSGPPPPNAATMLMNGRFGELLGWARENFDHVVVDAPPVLGLADAPVLASQVEGGLFVIEANATKTAAAKGALARIAQAQGHVFGMIVTKLDKRNDSYGYGYGYGYGREG